MTTSGDLAAPFAGLPAALQALQDRAVAEAVQQAAGLLRDHYALYHRSAGGGGLVLLAAHEVTTVGGEHEVRLPASGSLSSGYGALVLLWQARISDGTGTTLSLNLRLNDDTASNYRYVQHAARSDAAHSVEGTTGTGGFSSQTMFYAARVPGTDAATGGAAAGRVLLPVAGRSAFWQPLLSDSVNAYNAVNDTQLLLHGGHWMQAAAVTSVTCLGRSSSADRSFDVGSHFAVYGMAGA